MNDNDAIAHVEEAYRLLTSEAYRIPVGGEKKQIEGFCGVVADLRRIDSAIGPRGESVFSKMAETIEAAYTEIKLARMEMARWGRSK